MQRFKTAWLAYLAVALLAIPAGCGGSASPYVGPTASPTPAPITPSIPAITLGTPSPNATPCPSACTTTFTVSEPGYTGAFHGVTANANVATVALLSQVQQSRSAQAARIAQTDTVATFVVTAVGSGTTTITISDDNGNSFPLPVTVSSGITLNPQLQQP